MTKHLRLLLAAISIFALNYSFSQVTLVSGGTHINGGGVLPNGHPVMTSDDNKLYTTNGSTATVISTLYNDDSSTEAFYKGDFYFTSPGAGGIEKLYATDGTSGGTHFVAQVNTKGYSDIDNFLVFNNLLYFTADDSVHGKELWSTDGTSGNTRLVGDINGKPTGSIPDDGYFFTNGGNVFFPAYNADSVLGLYKLTTSGINLIKNNLGESIDLNAIISCTAFGNKIIFTVTSGDFGTGSIQLWVTDGSTAGTVILKDFGAGSYGAGIFFTEPTVFNGKVLFDGYDALHGGELWVTDGTAANTKLLKDINTGADASTPFVAAGVVINNKLLFSASTDGAGEELWSTDGTAANTTLVKDINPGTGDASPQFLFNIGAEQSLLTSGNFTNINYQLFYTLFKGKAYFTADDGTRGIELWSTDGTAANTTLVKDINPGAGDGLGDDASGFLGAFYTTTGIYIDASGGTATGYEPWVTDGTSAGTTIVKDVYPGSIGSDPTYQFIYNNQLYFTTYNDGDISDSDLYKINTSLTILPVSLANFAASLQSSSVLLNWQTATELNTDHFGVERSVDGAHFNNIGDVKATGTSSTTHNYTLNDYTALHLGSSTLYYRLKTIDKDGKYTYSSIIKLQLHGGEFAYSLSPNPVHSQLTVSFTTDNGTKQASLKMTDANGKPVYEKSLQGLQPGSVQQYINVAGLAGGIYYIQLITDSGTKTLKFVKQ